MKSVIDLAEQVKDYAAAGKTIAPVENGATAVGSYAIGEQFIREGVLYKAKTSITAGDTLTLNTNYELADDLDTQLSNVKQALNDEVEARAELGAHNLFDLKTSSPVVETQGVTFTTNTDNRTVTANGQSTASSGSTSRQNSINRTLKAGSYIFSAGLPTTGSDTTYYCFLYDITNSRRIATVYADEDVAFTINNDITLTVFMSVCPGYTANNLIYKPMIRDARDKDKTFAPFSMTNKELTDAKANKSDLASISITGTTNNTGATISAGTYFYLNGTLVKAKTSIANNATLTLDTNYEVVTAGALNELIVFNNRGNVSSSSLENYTQAGIFQVYATDVLAEGWGILIVTTDTSTITQTLINGVGIAFRRYSANQSAWSTWSKTLFS